MPYPRNGINGDTGEYLTPKVTADDIVKRQFPGGAAALLEQRKKVLNDEQLSALKNKVDLGKDHLGVKENVAADKLDQAGWGVIFAQGADPAIVAALRPLLDHRKREAGTRYRELGPGSDPNDVNRGYDPANDGESKQTFLTTRGAPASGPVDPALMPYYLLIVCDPEVIPFRFQYDLDVAYAVGRLHFDTPLEYARYAASVVAAEKGEVRIPKKIAFFGTAHPDDDATQLSSEHLIEPLATQTKATKAGEWDIEAPLPADCKRDRLQKILGGASTPALLMSASHGMGGFSTDARQHAYMGSLLCQDWPGPNAPCSNLRNCYLAAEDITDEAEVAGMIAVVFACYGAGYPEKNTFWQQDPKLTQQNQIAARNSVSLLAKRLLAHPNGGALAVMGHIDQAWETSFQDSDTLPALASYESALDVLMGGKPIGMASEYFNQKYSELGNEVGQQFQKALNNPPFHLPEDSVQFANLLTACNDAQNYIVVGDPAVRLVFSDATTRKVNMAEIQTTTTNDAATEDGIPAGARLATAPLGASVAKTTPTTTTTTTLASDSPAKAYRNYGIGDDIMAGLNSALESVGDALKSALATVTTLTVTTYTNTSLAQGRTGAVLRAQTTISLGGNTESIVPEDDGKVDDAVWKIHTDALDRAIQNRTELLRVMLSAVGLGNAKAPGK